MSNIAYETKIEVYKNVSDMKRGIKREQKHGWEVVETRNLEQGYGAFKTCCLGIIFLPLALLGRKPSRFQVTFRRGK